MFARQRHQQQQTILREMHGLAMVDLVITVLIMGMSAAIAVPRFSTAVNDHALKAVCRQTAAVMNYASRQARITSQPITLTFDTNANSIAVTGIDDPNHAGQPWSIQLSAVADGVDLVTADFSGTPVVTYGVDGRPDASGSLTLAVGGMQETVSVSKSTGKASVS
jgi:Tfp pilus assembly protein PilE